MNKKTFPLLLATTMVLGACSTDTLESGNNEVTDDALKTKIALSAGDDESVATTRAGFTAQTRIVARIVSEKRDDSETKCVKTVLSAAQEANSAGYSVVSYNDGKTRYWDDAHGRYSRLSVYAVAIPNKNDASDASNLKENVLAGSDTWSTTDAANNSIIWTVKTTQAYDDLAAQDLTYSNNIKETGNNGVYTWNYSSTPEGYPTANATNATCHVYTVDATDHTDGRLYFTQKDKTIKDEITDAPGHFDKGQMEFKHSLARIQVNLLKGEGFTSAPFNITTMQVLGQSASGTFDIETATWSNKAAATPINMAKWATAATRTDGKTNAATYEAQVLPGYNFAENTTNVLELTVDGNTYYVTNKMLHDALSSNSITNFTTEMAKRYIFDVTVKKNQIENITAKIVDWNIITAANTDVDNSHLTFSFYNNGDACTDINLYKYMQSLDKVYTDNSYQADPVAGSAYTEVAGLVADGSTGKYKTSDFYQDNQTAYHFRSINNIAENALNGGKTEFTMTSGEANNSVNDYHWGAPMKATLPSGKLSYDTSKGYLDCIDKGIVAASTTSTINLTELHMMSQVVVKLTTPSGGAAVNLVGATVKITRFSKTGTVNMGSGKITPNVTNDATNGIGETACVSATQDGSTGIYVCTFNVVPQELKRNSGASDNDYVGITIHTADNNEYYIVKRLSDIEGTAGSQITNMQEAGKITKWYPGHKYIYTFNITKTEIKNITATIVDWNTVTAGNTDLDLEK